MAKTSVSYITLLILCLTLPLAKSRGANPVPNEAARQVDSLNHLAFQQKRFDVAKALSNLFVAENVATTANYEKGLATSYLYEAGIFHQNGYETRALSTYYKSLQIFKRINDTFNIAFTSQQIGLSLQANGNLDEALELYNHSLTVYTNFNKQEDIANVKNSIGLVYLGMGRETEAENSFKEALAICTAIKYVYGEKKSLYNLGLFEEQRNNFPAAKTYYHLSLGKDEIIKDKYGAALNQLQLGSIERKLKKPDASIALYKEAYQSAFIIAAYNLMKEAATKVIEGYRQKGEIKNATQWQDSLIKILRTQNENEKVYALNFIDVIKNQDIQKINAEKEVSSARRVQKEQLLIITVGTFILITVAVLAVLALVNYQRQRFFGKELKQKNAIIEKNSASLDLLNKEISQQNLMLETDNKTKNKLLSIISHDLRTPLVNTKGILNLVNEGMLPQEEARLLLQQLETQYLGTTSLLDNLLFWIKGQMNGQPNEKVRVGLYQLMKNLEEEHKLPLLKKNIQLKNNIDKSVSVIVEKEMIRIVCRNLISNAIKFTNENGVIELDSCIEGTDALCLTVKDSGIGMTKEAIEKVNAKVYYHTTGTSYEKGSGFGLMLCRDLITKHGGELIVKSEPGKGSSFTIKIPYSAS